MAERPTRAAAVAALRDVVHAELAAVLAVASAAYDEATHAESKAENKYDTRSLEASYLAAGQAVRAAALRRLTAFFDGLDADAPVPGVVGLGALLALEDDRGAVRWCLVAPEGGGVSAEVGGVTVRLVTLASPLGRGLLGLAEGDVVEVEEPRRQVVEISEIR